jgi:hypothetical protein
VQSGLDAETSPDVRAASGRIVDLLARVRSVHLDLERRLVGAREVFLSAQVRQRLARRRRLRMLALGDDLLLPVLAAPRADATVVTSAFADRALGVSVPRLVRFDDLVDQLWAPPRQREAAEPEVEDVGAADPDAEEDVQRYPAPVVAAAREVLDTARDEPARVSALLDACEGSDEADQVAELVLLTALWAFAPDAADGESTDERADAGALASGLVAEDDGRVLDHRIARGRDLVLRASVGTAAEDEAEDMDAEELTA